MDRVFIIAEAETNHNGDIDLAKQLIDMAVDCGCDAVKFQKRTIDAVYSQEYLDSPRESPWGKTQRAQKKGLEFEEAEYDEIDRHCRRAGIDWFASAWDVESQLFLRQYRLKYNKVASAMLTNTSLLNTIAEEHKHTYIGTGMSSVWNIATAVHIFLNYGCHFTLMHCLSEMPATEKDLNLRCVKTLRERYSCNVGYSGHELSVLPSIIAVMLGATAIERHITLDKTMYGSDQANSIEAKELKQMVDAIRSIPALLGDGVKRVTSAEEFWATKLRG